MKIKINILLLTACFAAVAAAKPASTAKFANMLKDRAIVVFCDQTSDKVLDADSLVSTNLAGSIVYTNKASVGVMCLGDLVNPPISKMEISGPKVTLVCKDGKVAGMYGQKMKFHSEPDAKFLHEVQAKLATKQRNQPQ